MRDRRVGNEKQSHDAEVFGWDRSAWWLVGFSSDFLTLINISGKLAGDVCRALGEKNPSETRQCLKCELLVRKLQLVG